jgi:hypothetical protein
MTPEAVSGQNGITVTKRTNTLGTGSTALTYDSGVIIGHSNSVTAVTSAVFKKITYDAQGHITGTANVTASDLPSHTHNYAGSSSAGGPATKVATTVTNGTEDTARYGIAFVGVPDTSNAQAVLKNNDFSFNMSNGTNATGNTGHAEIVLGNHTPSGTAGNKNGILTLYSTGSYYGSLNTGTLTAVRTYTLPDDSGTLALTSDLDSYLPLSGGTMTGAIAYNNATTRLQTLKNLTIDNVGTSATYFLTITTSWGKGGYTSVANAKTVLGMGTLASRSYVEITSITTVTTGKKYTCTANTNTYKTFMVIFSYGSTYMTQWFTVTGSTAAYYPIFASMSTNAEAVLSIQCSAGAAATITFTFSSASNDPVVEKVIGFNFGG